MREKDLPTAKGDGLALREEGLPFLMEKTYCRSWSSVIGAGEVGTGSAS